MGAVEPDPQGRMAGKARMRRYRERRRAGLRCTTIELRSAEIATLVRLRLLAPTETTDPLALREAVHGFLDIAFSRRS